MRLYFYCIFTGKKRNKPYNALGLENQRVFHIHNNDLFAAVSITTKKIFERTDDNLNIHNSVLDYYNKNYNILPFRFNTIVGEKIGKGILFNFYDELLANLKRVNKRVQFEVQVFKSPPLKGEFIKNSKFDNSIIARDKIKDVKTKYLISQINGPLIKMAVESKIDRLVTNNLILSAKYLVSQKDQNKFMGEIDRLKSIFSKLSFYSKYPEPPYDFVDVEITKNNAFIK